MSSSHCPWCGFLSCQVSAARLPCEPLASQPCNLSSRLQEWLYRSPCETGNQSTACTLANTMELMPERNVATRFQGIPYARFLHSDSGPVLAHCDQSHLAAQSCPAPNVQEARHSMRDELAPTCFQEHTIMHLSVISCVMSLRCLCARIEYFTRIE